MPKVTSREVLDCPMESNDACVDTVREYLQALLAEVWEYDEGFSGKRPFGNSGWKHEVYYSLAANAVIHCTRDANGDPDEIPQDQRRHADKLIAQAIWDLR